VGQSGPITGPLDSFAASLTGTFHVYAQALGVLSRIRLQLTLISANTWGVIHETFYPPHIV
jgi:hypothetical protein